MKNAIRFMSMLLIGVMLSNTAFAADFKYGDGDNDRKITATDAVMAVMNRLKGIYIESLDVDKDGKLTENDEELILKKALNDDFAFPESSTEESSENSTDESSSETTTDSSSGNEDESSTETSTEEPVETSTETSSEEPAETSTEEFADNTTEDNTYNKEWNFTKLVSEGVFAENETISEATTVDGLELIATGSKSMVITSKNKELNGVKYTHTLNLSGTGSTAERAAAFDVNGNTVIKIVLISGGSDSDRTLKITDEGGNSLTSDTVTAYGSGITEATVYINYTGKVYLYSQSSGIHIFSIERSAYSGSDNEESSEVPSETSSEESSETSSETSTEAQQSDARYNVQGFAAGLSDMDASNYTVYEAKDAASFLSAVKEANSNTDTSSGTVIKVTADLNLGYDEVPNASAYGTSIIKELAEPLLHPTLMTTGVSQITIKGTNVVIYSPNGNKIKHANLVLSGAKNVVIRNLTFCELWEWDEYSFGHYDRNDWDYIGIQGTSQNIWIDHCTFSKSYDGVVDSKAGSNGLSITWCKFDSETDREFIKAQFDYLEEHKDDSGSVTLINNTGSAVDCLGLESGTSQQTVSYANALYKYLRDGAGLTKEEILEQSMPQQKTHLVGATELEGDNANLEITLGYNYYINSRDRLPRLRGGNAHIYNTVIDSSTANTVYSSHSSAIETAAKISGITGDKKTEKFDFSKTNQAFVSTEDGALAVENSIIKGVKEPIKNNQKKNDDQYTGKFKAEKVSYNGTVTTWDGSQEAIDNDTSNVFYPKNSYGAAAKVFSWNSTPNYSDEVLKYTAVDLSGLEAVLKSSAGAGSVNLDWTKLTYNK